MRVALSQLNQRVGDLPGNVTPVWSLLGDRVHG